MKKIFTNTDLNSINQNVEITGSDFHHLKVFRVKKGDIFLISDQNANEYISVVEKIESNRVVFKTLEIRVDHIKRAEITVLFSVLKGDRNEYLLQKCTEIGVDNFVPVITDNTIVELTAEKIKSRGERWLKIVKEASMQSGALTIPKINTVLKFDDAVKLCQSEYKLFGEINSSRGLSGVLSGNYKSIAVFIGPEGDFSNREFISLKESGWIGVNFPTGILKSDTAAVYFLSIINFLTSSI